VTRSHARRERESQAFRLAWAQWNDDTSPARSPFQFPADPTLPTLVEVERQVAAGALEGEVYIEKQYRQD